MEASCHKTRYVQNASNFILLMRWDGTCHVYKSFQQSYQNMYKEPFMTKLFLSGKHVPSYLSSTESTRKAFSMANKTNKYVIIFSQFIQ